MPQPLVIEGIPDLKMEDHGAAMICEVSEDGRNFFVRLQSYDETYLNEDRSPDHSELEPFFGRLVRVTVEVIE